MLYEANNISRTYKSGEENITVIKDVNLQLEKGTMTAIVGASGSGKTTLLQILGSLDRPSTGQLFFKGNEITGKSDKHLASFRNSSLGFIFQFHHLLPEFTTLENVLMPARIAGKYNSANISMAKELLKRVELSSKESQKVTSLSGGEQQRTALARALIMQPSLLLADEPTGNLDNRSGDIVFNLLRELSSERELSTIMVTHNNALAAKMDRRLKLENGYLSLED
ncbi:MAG: ABC transporter ATP-binding protein [Desulfotalea sp.]